MSERRSTQALFLVFLMLTSISGFFFPPCRLCSPSSMTSWKVQSSTATITWPTRSACELSTLWPRPSCSLASLSVPVCVLAIPAGLLLLLIFPLPSAPSQLPVRYFPVVGLSGPVDPAAALHAEIHGDRGHRVPGVTLFAFFPPCCG